MQTSFKTRPGWAFAGLVLLVLALRLALIPPAYFVEGDDAAVAAGLTQLCQGGPDSGRYCVHPPVLPVADDPQAALQGWFDRTGSRLSGACYYRYESMAGVYLAGRALCGLGHAAFWLAWLCFAAGTLFPIFLSLFFWRLFRPVTAWALPTTYLLMSLSPEAWVSGSAYINDKILACTLLSLSLYSALGAESRKPAVAYVTAALAAAAFALAVWMRFDSLLFIPAVVLALIYFNRTGRLRAAGLAATFMLAAAAAFWGLALAVQASPLGAYRFGAALVNPSGLDIFWTAGVALSAFGPSVLIALALGLGAAAGLVLQRLVVFKTRPGLGGLVPAVIATGLILPELLLLGLYPFSSQKYLLMGATSAAGVAALLPFRLWESYRSESRTAQAHQRGNTALAVTLIALTLSGGLVRRGEVLGADGNRALGGHLTYAVTESPISRQARQMVAFADASPHLEGVIYPYLNSWMFEEAAAYQALVSGWQANITPSEVSVSPPVGGRQEVRLYLSEYIRPDGRLRLWLAADFFHVIYPGDTTQRLYESFKKRASGQAYTLLDVCDPHHAPPLRLQPALVPVDRQPRPYRFTLIAPERGIELKRITGPDGRKLEIELALEATPAGGWRLEWNSLAAGSLVIELRNHRTDGPQKIRLLRDEQRQTLLWDGRQTPFCALVLPANPQTPILPFESQKVDK